MVAVEKEDSWCWMCENFDGKYCKNYPNQKRKVKVFFVRTDGGERYANSSGCGNFM